MCNRSSLNRNILWVWVADPVFTEVWDLGVESLLEQRPVVSEGSDSSTGSTTPDDQVLTVRLGGSVVERNLGNLVCWTSDVLNGLVIKL